MKTSAQIITFQGACIPPVAQMRTNGRLPNSVTSIRIAKSKRKDKARGDELVSCKLQELESACLSMRESVARFTQEIERIKVAAAKVDERDVLINELENERINLEKAKAEIAAINLLSSKKSQHWEASNHHQNEL